MLPLLQSGDPVLIQVVQGPTRPRIEQPREFMGQLLVDTKEQSFDFSFLAGRYGRL